AIERLTDAIASGALRPDQAAGASDRLGRAYALVGEFESAIALYERALAEAQTRKDDLSVLRFSTLLANAVLDSGNISRAEELLGKALALADSARDPLDRARVWWSQSR